MSPWPSTYDYALALDCPRCGAEAGQMCNAPNKQARAEQSKRLAREVGLTVHPDPLRLLHKARQDAGARHYMRDVGRAPWPEDREPGARYDTLDAGET